MTGEEYLWYRLADRLGLPLDVVMAATTVSQFKKWNIYIVQENEEASKADYFAAQIALEVWKGANPRHRKKVNLKHFLLKFKTEKRGRDVHKPKTAEELARQTAISQKKWLKMFPNVVVVKRSEQDG